MTLYGGHEARPQVHSSDSHPVMMVLDASDQGVEVRTYAFLTPADVCEADLKKFVLGRGGAWHEDSYVHEGSLFRGGAQLTLALVPEFALEIEEFTRQDIERLGFEPKSSIVLGIFHYHEVDRDRDAWQLAMDVGRELEQTWGGAVD